MTQRIFFIGFLSLLLGCYQLNFSDKDLHGKWQAVQLIEAQDTFAYDISQVELTFLPNRQYHYQGNLKNVEAGNYYLLGKILYTTDTLVNPRVEKAVEIKKLGKDSLTLLMNDEGKIRSLALVRK